MKSLRQLLKTVFACMSMTMLLITCGGNSNSNRVKQISNPFNSEASYLLSFLNSNMDSVFYHHKALTVYKDDYIDLFKAYEIIKDYSDEPIDSSWYYTEDNRYHVWKSIERMLAQMSRSELKQDSLIYYDYLSNPSPITASMDSISGNFYLHNKRDYSACLLVFHEPVRLYDRFFLFETKLINLKSDKSIISIYGIYKYVNENTWIYIGRTASSKQLVL